MDESTQHYQEVRALLAELVATWPWDRPGTAFENAKVYLDFHCADCGAKLSLSDLAAVLELEMLRLGTVDARKAPTFDPICVGCYIRRAAPVCLVLPTPITHLASTDARFLTNAQSMEDGALRANTEATHAPTLRNAADHTEHHPALLEYPSPPDMAQHAVTQQLIQPQRAWWWRYAGECLLVVAMLLIVLALGFALNSFPKQMPSSTRTRPTAPAAPTTAAPTSRSAWWSFRGESNASVRPTISPAR